MEDIQKLVHARDLQLRADICCLALKSYDTPSTLEATRSLLISITYTTAVLSKLSRSQPSEWSICIYLLVLFGHGEARARDPASRKGRVRCAWCAAHES